MPKQNKKNNKIQYSRLIFALIFCLSYFLIPKKIFNGWYTLLGVTFMISFSLMVNCLVLQIKEKYEIQKSMGKHFVGIFFGLLGLSALQLCTVGASFCAVSLGTTIVAAFLPTIAIHFISKYAEVIIIISILVQFYTLYRMRCLRKSK